MQEPAEKAPLAAHPAQLFQTFLVDYEEGRTGNPNLGLA